MGFRGSQRGIYSLISPEECLAKVLNIIPK